MSTSKMLVSPKGLAGGGLTDSRRRSRVFKDDKFLGGDTTSSLGPSSPGKDRLSEKSEYHRSDYGGLDLLKNKIEILEADLARRQESYIRRERAYKTRIEDLECQLEEAKDTKLHWMHKDKSMLELRRMHSQIMGNVDIVQDRTAKILQEQERDLLRAFRARLFDVQTELEKEKSRKDDGAGAWIEKSRKLETELDWTEETADRLDRKNQSLTKENNHLKAQFRIQEEDRSYLIKQLVAIKKDNMKMRSEIESLENKITDHQEEIDRLQVEQGNLGRLTAKELSASVNPTTMGSNAKIEADHRYKEIIKKLKRTLDTERRNLRGVRERLSEEIRNRTELETFLRHCMEDVKKEIKVVQGKSRLPTIKDFTPQDRERVLSLLLSQERVVALLYDKTFPPRIPGSADSYSSSPDVNSSERPITAPAHNSSTNKLLSGSFLRPNSAAGF